MTVLYDYQCFVNDRVGGISKFFFYLIDALLKDPEIRVDVAGKISNNLYALELGKRVGFTPLLPSMEFPGQRKLLKKLNNFSSVRQIRRRAFTIMHPTYYHPYVLDHIGDKKLVVTVYDMIHELFGIDEYFGKVTMLEAKKRMLMRADRVIAISESTKRDILKYVPIPADKIDVVYLGVEQEYKEYPSDFFSLPTDRYLLFVGRRSGYKNFAFMAEAISPLLLETGVNLICVGGGELTEQEKSSLKKLGIDAAVFNYARLGEDELNFLYQHALGLIYPSVYEGFGMPPLEAMRNRCPVLLSNTSSMPEVGGEAVLYFDPHQPETLREVTAQLISDAATRSRLIEAGLVRINLFTWDKTVDDVKRIYLSLK